MGLSLYLFFLYIHVIYIIFFFFLLVEMVQEKVTFSQVCFKIIYLISRKYKKIFNEYF